MSVVKIKPQLIRGVWRAGCALDLHSISSTPIGEDEFGHMKFDTVRTAIAERLYQLKYCNDQSAAVDIIDTAVDFLKPYCEKFDLIVPVPPSKPREVQPVLFLAEGIGTALTTPVANCVKTNRPTTQLKSVTDPEERKKLLDGLYAVDSAQTCGKKYPAIRRSLPIGFNFERNH